jgi:hypothetical protein
MGINTIGYGLKSLANPSTSVTLQGGQYAVLPNGQYMVMPGKYTFLQWYDPVSMTWKNMQGTAQQTPYVLMSDGYNYRLMNPTGCVVGAVVTNGGTANTAKNGFWAAGSSSTPGVVATTTGTATFNAIVGGVVTTTAPTIVTGGQNYVLPPLVTFSNPPAGGLVATGYATLTSGAVSSITITNQGAGYASAPTITLTAVAGDNGTGATATTVLDTTTNTGKLVALTMANWGSAYTAVPTITIAGLAGSPAATAIMCFAVTTATTVTAASGGANGSQLSYVGQKTAGASITTNPDYTTGLFTPRNGLGAYNTSATFATQTIIDGGLSQIDSSNLAVIAVASTGTVVAATTFASGASGGVTDQSFVVPI